jgi:hypothetical protein
VAKKVLLIVFGLVILLIGLAVTALGSAGLAFGGHSGVIESGFHSIGTSTYGFVSNPGQVRRGQGVEVRSGNATLRVAARSSQPVFIGVGPAQQVDSYLNGVPYETVTDVHFDPFRLDLQSSTGTVHPAKPGDQSFWVAKATGTSPDLSWPIVSGSYRVVMMNANGSAGVLSDTQVGLRIPGLFGASLGTTIAGGLLSLIGLGLLIWGIATKRRQPAAVQGYGPPGYGAPGAAGYPTNYPPQGYPPPGQEGQGYQGYPPQGGYPPQSGYPPQGGNPPSAGPPPSAGYPPTTGGAGYAGPMEAGSGAEHGVEMPWTGTGDSTGTPPGASDATTEPRPAGTSPSPPPNESDEPEDWTRPIRRDDPGGPQR